MRRASSLVVLIALGLLALPTTALGARATGSDSDTIVVVSGDVTVPRGETVDGIVVASGNVHLAGRSTGDVVLFSGNAVVSGRIDATSSPSVAAPTCRRAPSSAATSATPTSTHGSSVRPEWAATSKK